MGRKKRKKDGQITSENIGSDDEYESSDSSNSTKNKYETFRVLNYTRTYPENGGNFDYIVFFESTDAEKPLGDRDLMNMSSTMKRFNKGVKQLIRMNKYKIGVIFERASFANAALINSKYLDIYKMKASIPAGSTEVTGVITHVPINLSNQAIYDAISNNKNVVQIRRFMRRTKTMDEFQITPTQTVSITFSCPVLPDSIDLNSWRFTVRPYIPPIKQCLRCLRYGHIGKFCKNAERCSVCGENHNFRTCTVAITNATCVHCQGQHIAISRDCPVKIRKMKENTDLFQKRSYNAVVNDKSCPHLSQTDQFMSLLNSDKVLDILLNSIVKLISLNKSNQKEINSKSIKDILTETFNIEKNNFKT